MSTLRAGIVGLDHYHVTGWVKSLELFRDRLEIVALYDPDPARGAALAPRFHDPTLPAALDEAYRALPFYTDLAALLREERLDLALVALPNVAAPAAIRQLAGAGVHLLVDKPGARTAGEAEPAFAAARAAGVRVAVGLTRRYGRGWKDARAMVAEGRLGRLLTTEAIFTTSSVAVRGVTNAIFDGAAAGGGILHWLGIHDIDQLLWLTGDEIVEVRAMTANVGGNPIDVEDAIAVSLRWAGGALGTIHYAYALPRPGGEGYLALRGVRGSVSVRPDGTLTWIGGGGFDDPVTSLETSYTNRPLPGYGATGAAIIADLLAAIVEQRDPLATGDHIVRALRVIDATYESARTGRAVRVG